VSYTELLFVCYYLQTYARQTCKGTEECGNTQLHFRLILLHIILWFLLFHCLLLNGFSHAYLFWQRLYSYTTLQFYQYTALFRLLSTIFPTFQVCEIGGWRYSSQLNILFPTFAADIDHKVTDIIQGCSLWLVNFERKYVDLKGWNIIGVNNLSHRLKILIQPSRSTHVAPLSSF